MLSSAIVTPACAGEYVALPDTVCDFISRLRRVPVGAWAEAARQAEEAEREEALQYRPGAGPIGTARSRLRRLVAGNPGLATLTQRRIQDLTEVAAGFTELRETAAMKRVALGAALGLAKREELGDELFVPLYAPFAALVPLDEVEVLTSQAASPTA